MWADAMSSDRSEIAPVISDSKAGAASPFSSDDGEPVDSVLRTSTRGFTRKAWTRLFGFVRLAEQGRAGRLLPDKMFPISLPNNGWPRGAPRHSSGRIRG